MVHGAASPEEPDLGEARDGLARRLVILHKLQQLLGIGLPVESFTMLAEDEPLLHGVV